MDLTGRTAIVTGGAQGIGRATVERFVRAGASGVVIADIRHREAESAAQQITQTYGGQVVATPTDAADPKQVEAMVQDTIRRFGRIDILVNNAGICPTEAWEDTTLESWTQILRINLTGAFLCTRAVIPQMQAQRYGRIVYMSSEGGLVGSLTAHVAYGVSKAGLLALMKSVAKGFAADGILANAVAPGPIDTPLGQALGSDFWAAVEERTLLKRHGTAGEVADAVLFLVTDRSTYITGQVLRVSAGTELS